MDLVQNLDDFIGEEYAIVLDEELQQFTIDSADRADWALRKIAKYQNIIADAESLTFKRVSQITMWLHEIKEENQRQISFFEALLEPYAKQQITGKKRSMKLPTGTFGFKAQQPKFVRDEEKLTEWAEKNAPTFVKKEPVLQWGEFKKTVKVSKITEVDDFFGEVEKLIVVDVNGEVIPGLTAEEQPDKFYVKCGD